MPALSSIDVPFLGNLALCATLVLAAFTFMLATAAGRGRPHLLQAARHATYATCGMVAFGVCLLGFAFQTHDFRIRYVAKYSDRSMEWMYLVSSLWGGQDGSLLWWSFLLCGYTVAATWWLKGKHRILQPWILATLMSILAFFIVLMLFAANPFATYVGTELVDGEGLNPLLQNYWMMIHPPSLYMGFVGWAVPFAFCIAALVTGRLSDEWIQAARGWAIVAWTFLSIGLTLGMLWSYEELGWGGYWAWDPVENASFLPWLIGTAYLHSVMVQERYGMLKVWNVFLLCLTFFMTIFGTWLTRSGLIASVHSFARSDIGVYFVYYMAFLLVMITTLIVWRLPRLKAEHKFHSLMSREFAFLLNNWILAGMMIFVLVATTFPLLSELFRGEEVTVGPPFYNLWMVPVGLMLLFLMGVGPLIAWRKASGKNLRKAFTIPIVSGITMLLAHLIFGTSLGYPPVLSAESVGMSGVEITFFKVITLKGLRMIAPVFSTTLCAFVMATIVQEFWRGTRVRMRKGESAVTALTKLMSRARRRYGGYIVHAGIVCMYLGFTGAAYDIEREAALRPGESMTVGPYELRYDQPRVERVRGKTMHFADMTLMEDGAELGHVYPAKFRYETHPEMPTTEVAIRSRLHQDLYVILSTVDTQTKRATFRAIVRPLVVWIWIGGLLIVLGSLIALMPPLAFLVGPGPSTRRRKEGGGSTKAVAAALLVFFFGLSMLTLVERASAQDSSSLHAGTVEIGDPKERQLFEQLLCQCGTCPRLPMDTCSCGWASSKRAELRERLEAGDAIDRIVASYRRQFGDAALSVPPDEGFNKAIWMVPVAALVVGAAVVFGVGRRFVRGGHASPAEGSSGEETSRPGDKYDDMLDQELDRLERDE